MANRLMDEFLSACGGSGPLVLGVQEPGQRDPSWRVFDQPFLVVGRHPSTDLFLKHSEVSRRHAYLQVIAGRIFCVDLQSRTGTRWGGKSGLWGWVHPDLGVEVGPFHIKPRSGGNDDHAEGWDNLPVPVSRSFNQPTLPEATVTILTDAMEPFTWQVSRSLVLIGSSPACKLRLSGPGIASVHASLVRTPSGFFAVDLLGPDGLTVNGRRVRLARLEAVNDLRIGPHRLRVCCHAPGSLPLPDGGASIDAPIEAGFGHAGSDHRLLPAPLREDPETVMLVRSMIQEFSRAQSQLTERTHEALLVALRSFAAAHGDQMSQVQAEMQELRRLIQDQEESHRRNGVQPALPWKPRASAPVEQGKPLTTPSPHPATTRDVPASSRKDSDRVVRHASDAPASPSTELHDQILDRIAQIRDERQTQWQKLLKSLFG